MKKTIFPIFLFCLLLLSQKTNAQAVRDRGVLPVAVNLNLVLRFQIIDGGNIEFVFNSIEDYRIGMGARGSALGTAAGVGVGTTLTADQQMYRSRFTVSASRRWVLNYGAEQATFMGTDNVANTLLLNNVGITMIGMGTHSSSATGVTSVPTNDFALGNLILPCALTAFPTVLITDAAAASPFENSGSGADNDFCIFWQCGTATPGGVTAMNANTILQQAVSPAADRYVTNVLFELDAL